MSYYKAGGTSATGPITISSEVITELIIAENAKLKSDFAKLLDASNIMREAMQWSYEMLKARDEMNSKVHCAPVRLSPITERVQMSLASYDAVMKVLNELV